MKWYTIRTYSGHEKSVIRALKQRIESLSMEHMFGEMLSPTREKIVINEGKKRKVDEKLYPGYIFVEMEHTDDTWHLVRRTEGVSEFVGEVPLAQINAVKKLMSVEAPMFEVNYKVGENVKIIDGPFAEFIGKIDAIDKEKAKLKVMVNLFGRETPVELDFVQVGMI